MVLLASATDVSAQDVEIKRLPARATGPGEIVTYDRWTVSFSRRHAPDAFELHGNYGSLPSALAAAERLKRRASGDRDWQLAVILIEGTPSYHKAEKGGSQTPVDRILAGAFARIDETLKQVRDAAGAAGGDVGGDIPATGDVLGEYAQTVENSYANAKELKDRLLQLQGKMTDREFELADNYVQQLLEGEADAFLEKTRINATRQVADAWAERNRSEEKAVNDLLDRIAGESDPAAQQALIEQLAQLQTSGKLSETIVNQNRVQRVLDEMTSAEMHLLEIQRIVADSKERIERILKKFNVPSVAGTSWDNRAGRDDGQDWRRIPYQIESLKLNEDGTVRGSEFRGNQAYSFSGFNGVWEQDGDQIRVWRVRDGERFLRFSGTLKENRLTGTSTVVEDESRSTVLKRR